MGNSIINHLFEFWEHIGREGQFLNTLKGYSYTDPGKVSWPSKIFDLNIDQCNIKALKQGIHSGRLPNSIGILDDNLSAKRLLGEHGFKNTSIVRGMYKNLLEEGTPQESFDTIIQVTDPSHAVEFAKIASSSFGYPILTTTIEALLHDKKCIKMFLGKNTSNYVSCGMIFLDKNNHSGIHMIGTMPTHRGLGLGKIMTEKLLSEAYKNKSKKVFLVASQAGERIYSKLGFIVSGALSSYSL